MYKTSTLKFIHIMIPAVSPKKTSERKRELYKEAQAYKNAIDGQVNDIKTETLRISKSAVIIGGVLAGVYLLVRWFSSDDDEVQPITTIALNNEHQNTPILMRSEIASEDSWLVKSIKGYILTFLVSIAKEKIMEAMSLMKGEPSAQEVS
jgi:hypothetical protein